AAGVPAVVSADAEDLIADRHLRARGHIAPQASLTMGSNLVVNAPWAEAGDSRVPPAPLLGEHNHLLTELTSITTPEMARLETTIQEAVAYSEAGGVAVG